MNAFRMTCEDTVVPIRHIQPHGGRCRIYDLEFSNACMERVILDDELVAIKWQPYDFSPESLEAELKTDARLYDRSSVIDACFRELETKGLKHEIKVVLARIAWRINGMRDPVTIRPKKRQSIEDIKEAAYVYMAPPPQPPRPVRRMYKADTLQTIALRAAFLAGVNVHDALGGLMPHEYELLTSDDVQFIQLTINAPWSDVTDARALISNNPLLQMASLKALQITIPPEHLYNVMINGDKFTPEVPISWIETMISSFDQLEALRLCGHLATANISMFSLEKLVQLDGGYLLVALEALGYSRNWVDVKHKAHDVLDALAQTGHYKIPLEWFCATYPKSELYGKIRNVCKLGVEWILENLEGEDAYYAMDKNGYVTPENTIELSVQRLVGVYMLRGYALVNALRQTEQYTAQHANVFFEHLNGSDWLKATNDFDIVPTNMSREQFIERSGIMTDDKGYRRGGLLAQGLKKAGMLPTYADVVWLMDFAVRNIYYGGWLELINIATDNCAEKWAELHRLNLMDDDDASYLFRDNKLWTLRLYMEAKPEKAPYWLEAHTGKFDAWHCALLAGVLTDQEIETGTVDKDVKQSRKARSVRDTIHLRLKAKF